MAKVKLKKQVAKADKTYVKKPVMKEIGPSYKYMGEMGETKSGKPSSEDSATYRKGFSSALSGVQRNPQGKNTIGGKYEYGKRVVGFDDRYNEGFSEGKDKALDKMKNKKK